MKINNKAIEILNEIESYGYEAYIVGGAVRDYLLGVQTNDYDITTNMPIELLSEKFSILDNGSSYASVTIVADDNSYEITHFRKDLKYANHRHPEIELVDTLLEDVKRRDFTINAMALDSNMKLYDFYNGMNDLKNRTIRAIGDPNLRFEEDALRILRGLHFSSKLGFEIEENTLKAMVEKKALLNELSHERIKNYFINIIYSNTANGIDYINKYDLFEYIPVYKGWLKIFNKDMDIKDLDIYYYINYNEYPPLIKTESKRLIEALKVLIDSKFDMYSIYKYQEELKSLFNVISYLNYDIIGIKEILSNLRIKNDNELSLSKADIASYFQGSAKAIAIKEVIKAILEKRIDNNKEQILLFIQGLDVIKC